MRTAAMSVGLIPESFDFYSQFPIQEIINGGTKGYEVLYSDGASVHKFWVNADSYAQGVSLFRTRFGCDLSNSHPKFVGKCRGTSVYKSPISTYGKPSGELIIRKITNS